MLTQKTKYINKKLDRLLNNGYNINIILIITFKLWIKIMFKRLCNIFLKK